MPPSRASSISSTDARRPELGPGTKLAGFRLERRIGHGSRSVVFEATQLSLDRRVALKLLRPDPDLLERFGRLRWPEHPHVVALYATGTCEHGLYVAMRLVHGSSLGDLREAGAVPAGRALGLLEQVAGALDAAHEDGIAHGGLRAGAVLVDADGRALVADFGLGPDEGTAEEDLIAFARLTGECLELAARTAYERVPDTGVHAFAANVPIRAGDLVGVEVTPGAAIGVRPRVSGATTARWFGPLIIDARAPEQRARSGFDHELLLRVEYLGQSARGAVSRLTGSAAKRAPAGAALDARDVELRGGRVRRVVVVRAAGTVAVDLFDGSRRLERLAVPDVDPAGSLLGLTTFGRPLLRLRWRNPDGRLLTHDYSVRSRSLMAR